MIVISNEDFNNQLLSLLEEYPNLRVVSQTAEQVDIAGKIHINCVSEEISVCQDYGIEISIPLNSDKLPTVRDTEKYIRNYPHLNWNKDLCLATDTDIYLHFRNGLDLTAWMHDYVEIYFVSYEYYKRYNRFPFGERAHGSQGILQFYRDYLNLSTTEQANAVIIYALTHEYKGHHICPCGSGKKLRNCHSEVILNIKNDAYLLDLIKRDLSYIMKEKAIKNARNS